MTKKNNVSILDFTTDKIVNHLGFMSMVEGKSFQVYIGNGEFFNVTADDTMPDSKLGAVVTGLREDGMRAHFIPFEGGRGIFVHDTNSFQLNEIPDYLEQYRTAVAEMRTHLTEDDFKTGLSITISKSLMDEIRPILKRMEVKTLAARNFLEGKVSEVSPDAKEDFKKYAKGAVRGKETEKSYKIKIDGQIIVRTVEFAEVVLDESIRIATGMFVLFNFKALESIFDSHIKKIIKRDEDLK